MARASLRVLQSSGIGQMQQQRMLSSSADDRFDAIVVGLGAHGSACLYNLAKWGAKVLGIERWQPGHGNASYHGMSRITRMAYFESPHYVPLLRKSFLMYEALERESKQKLFTRTGILNIGDPIFSGALAAAREHGLPHEVLTGAEASQRFPGYRIPAHTPVLYEAIAGILAPEAMVQAHCSLAQYHGARLSTGARVVEWQALEDGGVRVETDTGGSYSADKLVLAAGAWMQDLVPELKGLAVPNHVTVGWFETQTPELFQPQNFPAFLLSDDESGLPYYGFPEFGGQAGVKIGAFTRTGSADPDHLQRELTPEDEAELRQGLERYMPSANGRLLKHAVCMFTNTPDGHFIIDTHPRHSQVLLCSACTGHGFKLSPAIGYALASMVRHNGRCEELDEHLRMHRLDAARPGHAEALAQFARASYIEQGMPGTQK